MTKLAGEITVSIAPDVPAQSRQVRPRSRGTAGHLHLRARTGHWLFPVYASLVEQKGNGKVICGRHAKGAPLSG